MTKLNPTVCDFLSQNWSFDANDPFFDSVYLHINQDDLKTLIKANNIYNKTLCLPSDSWVRWVLFFSYRIEKQKKPSSPFLRPTPEPLHPDSFAAGRAPRNRVGPQIAVRFCRSREGEDDTMTWLGLKQPRPFWSARSVGFAGVRRGEIFPCFSSRL